MPTGTEATMALLIKAINQDAQMQDIMGGTTSVYRDKIPTPIKYPFIYLAEATESFEIRHSESYQHRGPNYTGQNNNQTRNEMLSVHAVAVGRGGDLPWSIMKRLREMLIDEYPRPAPLISSGSAGDVYDVNILTGSRQILLPTPYADPEGKDLYQSVQMFILSTIKKGGC